MDISYNADLRSYNTFGIQATAKALGHFRHADEANELLAYAKQEDLEVLILGGGSNIVLARDVSAVVLKVAIGGIRLLETRDDAFIVEAGAGVPTVYDRRCVVPRVAPGEVAAPPAACGISPSPRLVSPSA